jgi:hypothetical protein
MALIVRLGVCIGMVMFGDVDEVSGMLDVLPLILIFGEALVLMLDMLF